MRTPRDIHELVEVMPESHEELMRDPAQARVPLQGHAGRRVHRRAGAAVDAPDAQRQAAGAGCACGSPSTRSPRACSRARRRFERSTPSASMRCCIRRFDRNDGYKVLAHGVAASPGAAVGEIVFNAPEAGRGARGGRDVILVRPFTEADDVAGFYAAKGILTSQGGKASHAALVARGMGVPAVTGAAVAIDVNAGELTDRRQRVSSRRQDRIDGSDGTVVDPGAHMSTRDRRPYFDTVLKWSDELRRLGVRANADTPATPSTRASSAAQGSGCAGPSTCSWPRTVCRRCAR